jgi:hypothetical protein
MAVRQRIPSGSKSGVRSLKSESLALDYIPCNHSHNLRCTILLPCFLFACLGRLLRPHRAKHPKIEIKSCSGGGGHVDLGLLQRVDEVWPSDNMEAFYAAAVSFSGGDAGRAGIGADLNHWSEQDAGLASKMIALYKRIRGTVQLGDCCAVRVPAYATVQQSAFAGTRGARAVPGRVDETRGKRESTPGFRQYCCCSGADSVGVRQEGFPIPLVVCRGYGFLVSHCVNHVVQADAIGQ